MILTTKMHDAVKNSPVGQMLGRLLLEEFARGGDTSYRPLNGNVIQSLWAAFMEGAGLPCSIEYENDQTAFDAETPSWIEDAVKERNSNLKKMGKK